jgi:hypothetical protein
LLSLSYVIIENHLSLRFGPQVQVNGKLKIDSSEENIITGTTLLAKDIVGVSKFNFLSNCWPDSRFKTC